METKGSSYSQQFATGPILIQMNIILFR